MKILLLGKTGLLGQALFRAFSGSHDLTAPTHEQCDILDISRLEKAISASKPNLIINASGYTKVDAAETEQKKAFLINADGVLNLARIASKYRVPLMHFSTDYVFNGAKSTGYAESDSPAPVSVYGASKAKGESIIINNLTDYYLVRTAWMYGPGGRNFVDTMLESARNSEPISVVNDQIGNPTLTLDVAQAVLALLEGKPYGIYHIVNEGHCSWFEFAAEIFTELGISKKIIPITSAELNRPAKRPTYSILKNTKLQPLRHWKEALKSYLTDKILIL